MEAAIVGLDQEDALKRLEGGGNNGTWARIIGPCINYNKSIF